MANDHAKGDGEAFLSSCHAALSLMNDFKPFVIKVTAPVASQGTAFAQKQQKGAGTPGGGSECSYNKEYFADKECYNCGKKGHPARCCSQKKGKTKKGTDEEKSVLSSKSNKTIKSLTKQVKMLSAHYRLITRIARTTLASPGKREMRTSSMHVLPLPPPIQMWPWLSSLLKLGIWISGVYGSWIVSQCLIHVATRTLPPRCGKPSKH